MEKTATKNIIPESIPLVKSITEVREEQSSAAQAKTEAAQKSEEDEIEQFRKLVESEKTP
jgi:hypothetical protein